MVESKGTRGLTGGGHTESAQMQENSLEKWTDGMQPPERGLDVHHELPADAVPHLSPEGRTFYAPPDADFYDVYEAGRANSEQDPIQIWRDVGHFGRFDFQRQGSKNRFINDLFFSEYTNASNFAVGVYMNAAGFSLEQTKNIAGLFARFRSSNPGDLERTSWWIDGWYAADSGMYSKRPH